MAVQLLYMPSTSWQPVSQWYNSSVGESGHYYHQHVVIPKSLAILGSPESVLDLACGQGVLARHLPAETYYQGIDIAPSLIAFAKKNSENSNHHFAVADVARESLPIQKKDFAAATIILALQNIEHSGQVMKNAAQHLKIGGTLLIVLNHPCFRIPRQSSWGVDEDKKTQYRRIDRYLSPLKIPITAHPGQKNSALTWSFHQPLSVYSQQLRATGFVIEALEEWSSDKTSVGKAAKMENRGRSEFPLFLALLSRKIS